ncbi:unnamed protein product [Rhodiola kirilowii]
MTEPLREIRDGYLIPLSFGTPPQVVQVYMDTGSDLTWVPCININHSVFDCIECDDNTNIFLKKNILFSPSHSMSSLNDSCASPYCIDIHSSDNFYDPCAISGCSLTDLMKFTCFKPCPTFSYTYGNDKVIVGTLSKDVLGVHGIGNNAGVMEIPKFRFGCVSATYGEPIGIAGFGRGSLSILSQLGFLQKGFSHCFLPFKFSNNPNISSPLVIGERAIASKDHLHFTPMLKSPKDSNLYYVGLESISVGNFTSPLKIKDVPQSLKELDAQGNGGMLMDSGTTYTHLPPPLYTQLLTALKLIISYPRAIEIEARSGFDLCYTIPCVINNCYNDDRLPTITFHFLNNVDLVLPKENCFYAMRAPSNSSVVKCLLIQNMEDGEYGPAGVFGSFQQQNVEVVYDLNKERVGFQVTDCAQSAATQGLHTA